jgi:hypothetical protein
VDFPDVENFVDGDGFRRGGPANRHNGAILPYKRSTGSARCRTGHASGEPLKARSDSQNRNAAYQRRR